ncbi:MAG: hypothetical protein J6C53_02225 [Clostridia bacterium]|nr:hypothetical protein [Clostridia bacterium]
MNKVKNLLGKMAISCALIGTLGAGAFVMAQPPASPKTAGAEFTRYEQIENNLPAFVDISLSSETSADVGKVGNTIYLFQNDSKKNIVIGNDEIADSGNVDNFNYGYYPNEGETDVYYYFDFQTSLSLYYNLTGADIANGKTGENLLTDKNIGDFTENHESPFVPTGYSFTPQKFDFEIKLDTTLSNLTSTGNQVVLNEEGCYTLAVPISIYQTSNNGITFTLSEQTIYYTFMIFNANTYFDSVTGRPNLVPSPNMQESLLTSSSAYSNYYFYNFSYGQSVNTLPTIGYDPEKFQLRIEYTDLDQSIRTSTIECNEGVITQLDENGNKIAQNMQFIEANIDQNGQSVVTFTKLGSYDISISYLYISKTADGNTTYRLPLEELENNEIFKNKAQRLYVYGYQAVYSDYADINATTNQPESKELKTFDFSANTFTNSADITSALNKYIIANGDEADKNNASMQNPTQASEYSLDALKGYAQNFINGDDAGEPVSSNQTPIKFISNATLKPSYSNIYSVETNADGDKELVYESSFQGFNQNKAGTYLYIVQYTFDSYMSTSGTLQSGFYHYQIFYFTVTNTTPTLTVYDSQFAEIYTGGYTNKSVYVLNDAQNNIYDAKVNITLSAYNYKTKQYFFEDVSIDSLGEYEMHYQQFETSANADDEKYNNLVAGKYGIVIENTSKYANALFTLELTSANSDKPSTRTFTIDTNPIDNISTRGATISSSTTYQVGEELNSYASNKPFIISWDEKASGATTYGYVKYIPMTSINYYSSLSEDKLAELLSRLISHDTLPVSYKLDIAGASNWTEYSNSQAFANIVPSTYVKSNDGIYILEVYDQAGNNAFDIFLKDSTSPIFIEEIVGDTTIRKIISNSESISVPEAGIEISINWTKNKAIYIENLASYASIEAYRYGINVENANENLQSVLSKFFETASNSSLKYFNEITVETTKENDPNGFPSTGITSYNGTYLIVPISTRAYLKDAKSSDFTPYEGTSYKITFIDENDEAIEGTYKILIRDLSNSDNYTNEALNYKLYPSGYLSFNVTSDASKMMVKFEDGETLDYASYSMTGNLFSYKDANDKTHYTHFADNGIEEGAEGYEEYEETSLTYKFIYHTPINGKRELTLSYIPVAENGSKLDSIVLSYYPYELKCKKYEGSDNYYYYYDIAEVPTRTINVFTLSDKNYDQGQVESFVIALGTDNYPLAGRYVIERTYVSGNATDKYDYFKRTLTFIVDDFTLISPVEGVKNEDGTSSSLESVVGGEIVLSMYSGENLSSIQVSFPSYNQNGLNSGSFYSKDTFTEEENLSVFAVQGNKLPMSLYIPQYKYTILNSTQANSKDKTIYSVENNDNLSYYGNAYYKQNPITGMFDVYIEGVVVDSFGTAEMAEKYIAGNINIAEYEIMVEVKATVTEGNRNVTKYYYSNGTTANGYLSLYLADGKNGVIAPGTSATEYFYQKGDYVVTIYQASNLGVVSNFYSIYKFGFKIISQEPDFAIYGSDSYELTTTNVANTYYTNSDMLTVEWQIPTNEYQAKIDEESIVIRSYPTIAPAIRGEIMEGTGTKYFTIDTSRLIVTQNSYITITMQYEGYNSTYYNKITKTVYFDASAPTQTLGGLMTLTESATNSAFPVNYQQYYMRKYYDYKNEAVDVADIADINDISYSYSIDTGYFRYYSYNVTKEFFNITLKQVLIDCVNKPYDTQFVYYKEIASIDSYTQVDKSSFSAGKYYYITTDSDAEVVCGYYEIVELDYAGNMTVYVVYLTDSTLEDDSNVRNDAITYFNSTHTEPTTIRNNQIENGFNIYSNSGFEISGLNYKSDPWALINVTIAGKTPQRFMKSPWLDENSIYKMTFASSGIVFEQVALSKIFEGVNSSSNKHQILFTDRITGVNKLVYLSIMDASLNTQKVEDPTKTSAILNISVPSYNQQASTTTSYAFPTQITIKLFDKTIVGADRWKTIIIANQASYGNWTTTDEYLSTLEYVSFTMVGTGTLQVAINLGANASQKVKYEILDNFGNTTTVIQLANEVAYKEISGNSEVYEITESDNSITYVSDQTIKYSFNVLLYSVSIYDADGNDITAEMDAYKKDNATTNISVYSFMPAESKIYDDYYKIVVKDSESEGELKTIHIRLVYNLPYLTFVANEVHTGGIVFNDKNQQPVDEDDMKSISSMSVYFNGVPYTTSGYSLTTYQNITLRFKNGGDYAYEGVYAYQDGYTYSVYISKDGGATWLNINSNTSATSGYTVSGVGDYLIFIKYDHPTMFTNLCKIFELSILDPSSSYYSITVDTLEVEKSDFKYKSQSNIEYEINYIVSVDYADKDNRLSIVENEELGVKVSLISTESTGTNVHVEIYHYESDSGVSGDFTIIYIEETNNFISTFTYDTAAGTTIALKDTSYAMIVAEKGSQNSFDKLKLNFTSSYGIAENKIKAQVLKMFNGSYVEVDCKVYTENEYSYIYLERAGSYRVKLYDSCSPANVQTFKGSEYIDIVFLSTVPFVISHVDEDGNTIVTEPIQKAVYNTAVTVELTNLYNDSYYQSSKQPQISVKLNGLDYTEYTIENRKYVFSQPGFYSIKFSATSKTGVEIREEEYNFSIIMKNELKFAYSISQYSNYYIEKVEKDGVDITEDLVSIGNYSTISINGKKYLSGLSIANSLSDEKTGDGRYKITVNPNSPAYSRIIGDSFTFEIRIGYLKELPINVSINEGQSTSDDIVISFNVQNLYNAVGDCYITVAGVTKYYTSETLADYGEIDTITITGAGTHFIQVYSLSGDPLYSYKVIKTDPLNLFAILAIILGVAALGAIIGITISIRKRQKAK